MFKRLITVFALLLTQATAFAATDWKEGQHYFPIRPAQPTWSSTGKIEVAEAFSYGCPACNFFLPVAEKLKASLPANAQLVYVPAAFNPAEDWPMFQRAYCTAEALGLVDKSHSAMFNAVWGTGELAVIDAKTNRIKKPLPSIEDAAKFYNRVTGVPIEKFLSTSKSFSVDMMTKKADELIRVYKVDQTPTIVVNGKYRLTVQSAGGTDQVIELVKWLVAKEGK